MNNTPTPMTHERMIAGVEYVSYSDYLKLQKELEEAKEPFKIFYNERSKLEKERDEAREAFVIATDQMVQAQSVLREVRRDLAEAQIGCLERARLLGIGGSMEAKVISERDELREKYDNLATKHMLAINKICNERDEARELVKAYQDYAQLLGDEINDMTAVAYVHGWRSNRYEQGKVLREKIKQMEEAK